ncbi:hypothetical protein KIPB_009685 [Kipferlia bialata]|uniref:Uncharacterized protein n=1 Tax=Kipferlia bialata TaxID=797122 RepID=A0A9K3GMB3_9EUKA|nr:hypothetical protein KIPB_009685 [Kipferlia bialata]|eukprot:g9685.t1
MLPVGITYYVYTRICESALLNARSDGSWACDASLTMQCPGIWGKRALARLHSVSNYCPSEGIRTLYATHPGTVSKVVTCTEVAPMPQCIAQDELRSLERVRDRRTREYEKWVKRQRKKGVKLSTPSTPNSGSRGLKRVKGSVDIEESTPEPRCKRGTGIVTEESIFDAESNPTLSSDPSPHSGDTIGVMAVGQIRGWGEEGETIPVSIAYASSGGGLGCPPDRVSPVVMPGTGPAVSVSIGTEGAFHRCSAVCASGHGDYLAFASSAALEAGLLDIPVRPHSAIVILRNSDRMPHRHVCVLLSQQPGMVVGWVSLKEGSVDARTVGEGISEVLIE